MFVLSSIIEAFLGGTCTCSLVLLKDWLVSMFHVLFIPCSLTILFPSVWHFPFPRIKWLVKYTLTRERASLLRHTENSSLNSMIKMFPASTLYNNSLPSDDILGIWQRTELLTLTLAILSLYSCTAHDILSKLPTTLERERERETERQTETDRGRDRDRQIQRKRE